ncbi:tRNA glutamyl-Q(34) synthetase GluQRS [Euryhalocaulis caribicus]|uniref:tRNA glutamyl-Q(34) synthetase GluQRS n=1 Tax=Euryhalocaulis caribicus TaxID=1161401 RepID=UPI0003A66D56|nr:tRNA glutamyl-Q(34) synthetase GluQRS [Euryhalocaulis caribicus]
MTDFITRFAPSPTGHLHLGHAFSAFQARRAADAAGGRFLLRIEDIDLTRCKPEYETAILEDLAWLGLDWEQPVRRQSDHFADYAAALEAMTAKGVMYRCFKTRREIMEEIDRAPHGPAEVYTGPETPMSADEEEARIASGEAYAWRISLSACRDLLGADFARLSFFEEGTGPAGETGELRAEPERLGDAVLARKDVATSYHLACTHDDALQGVSHVVRGQDLYEVTHLHRLIQAVMDWPVPVYRHHRLLADETGERLAKRRGSMTLQAMRNAGFTAEDAIARMGL